MKNASVGIYLRKKGYVPEESPAVKLKMVNNALSAILDLNYRMVFVLLLINIVKSMTVSL